ncbi:MAG: hypothetical protein EBE86_026260 [Hormoscilla sp. GUM202]|nr:hypothetical protein [Hormoscilla sp. GUM202]
MQYLLLYAIAIFLLWTVIRYLVIFVQLSKIALQYEKYEIKTLPELPWHLKQLFKHPVQELKNFVLNHILHLLQ